MFFSRQSKPQTFQAAMKSLQGNYQRLIEHNLNNDKGADLNFDQAMARLFPLGSEAKGSIDFLEVFIQDAASTPTQKEQARSLIDAFSKGMTNALEFHQKNQTKRALEKDSAKIKEDLNLFAINNDIAGLKAYLGRYLEVGIAQLDYALRVAAANNSIDVMKELIRTGANIKSSGPDSGQIALHYAINNRHIKAVECLLNQADPMDYFDPVGQLLLKRKDGKTSLDVLTQLDDHEMQRQMIDIIRSALMLTLHPATSKKELELISDTIDRIVHQQTSAARFS